MRTLTAILGNSQRLDGGAMFGNVPRALWSRWVKADKDNRIPLACRALLVQEPGRNILLETGVGCFFEPKLRERFGVYEDNHVLLESLDQVGLSHENIDIVILSHLHFDHAGGLLTPWAPDTEPNLLFPNATFIVGQDAFDRAKSPHPRDRASFIPALVPLLEESGRLELVTQSHSQTLGPDYRFIISNGHTPGLLLTEIQMPGGPVVFAADLIPGTPWMHLPITMGYDRFPERLIEEKSALLNELLEKQGRIFFTHDPDIAIATVAKDDRGRFLGGDPQPDFKGLSR
jgi:glyoxylase-like metal-dependent hydrolase (beta-lactamase superfamily II)